MVYFIHTHTAVVHVLLLLTSTGHAFVPVLQTQRAHTVPFSTVARVQPLASIPSHEESAKALTDYMTKAHEEKLKAVKAAEEKNQAEIEVGTVACLVQ
jgi:lipoate-protein ligase A